MLRKLFHSPLFWGMNLWLALVSQAQAVAIADVPNQEEILPLFGEACERVKNQETISSIRMRATDKATFEAVKNLGEVASLQKQYNDHDFNVLIYKIVDNYVEDLGVQTTQQDDQKICVEITGFVTSDNISAALDELKNELSEEDENQNLQDLSTQDIASQNFAQEADMQTNHPVVSSQQTSSETEQTLSSSSQEVEPMVAPKLPAAKLVYIAPLEFFNNTTSKEYVKILTRVFDNNAYFQLTDDEKTAGYVIYSKVLRAKVDAINSNTNRMQMVVSVEVKNKIDGSSAIEHQNRFILFNSSDDEQKVAAGLMQKLLTKAGKYVLAKVERMAQIEAEKNGEISEALITPKNSNLVPLQDVAKQNVSAREN